MKCKGTNKLGQPCRRPPLKDSYYCLAHDPGLGEKRKEIRVRVEVRKRQYLENNPVTGNVFALTPDEILDRITRLTKRQLEVLEFLCQGETYESMARVLGADAGSITSRVSLALIRAGVRSRSQLICLYTLWRMQHTRYQRPGIRGDVLLAKRFEAEEPMP